MGRRGPPPQPTKLRILHGNPAKRPLNPNEPQPTTQGIRMPKWLDRAARAEWRRVVPELERLGLLTVIDVMPLASYCQSVSNLQAAQRVLKAKGMTIRCPSGYVQQRPEVAISQRERQLIKAFCQEFGLTPSSRSRMALPNESREEPLQSFINRRTGGA